MSNGSKRSVPALAVPWIAVRKFVSRLLDWFVIQSPLVRLGVLVMGALILLTGIYSLSLISKQAAVTRQVKAMTVAGKDGEGVWSLNDKLPVVLGAGSVLGFLETHTVARIAVIYEPLMWNVSERVILVESQNRQYAYYPSDLETRIFTDKAVTAPWGSKLVFIPRGELSPGNLELFERLDQRFANARPQSEKDGWKAGISGLLSGALMLGLLIFLYLQFKGQFKSLKFIEPAQVQGSIDDLVGMDDIKAEVAQIKDQYLRRAEYAEYGIVKPFNVMFSGPPGTGKNQACQLPGQGTGAAVAEMGMYRKTRLNFGALARDGQGDNSDVDEETRSIMEEQSERLYAETKGILAGLKPLTAYLVDKLLEAGEMSLAAALFEIRSFEGA